MIKEKRIIMEDLCDKTNLTREQVEKGKEDILVLSFSLLLDTKEQNINLSSKFNAILENEGYNKKIVKKVEKLIDLNKDKILDVKNNKNLISYDNGVEIPLISLYLNDVAIYHDASNHNEDLEDILFEIVFELTYNKDLNINELEEELEEVMKNVYSDFKNSI